MAAWSAFYGDVVPMVLGCPYPTIDHALLRASQALFNGAPIWRAALTSVTVTAGNSAVTIASNAGNVWRVESARIGEATIDLIDEVQAIDRFGGDWESKEGTPTAMVMLTNGAGRLVPIPTENVTVKLSGCLYPADNATSIPDDLFGICRQAIVDGALGRLYLIADQPWSNDAKAGYHTGLAESAKSKLAYRAAQKFGTERIASSPKWF